VDLSQQPGALAIQSLTCDPHYGDIYVTLRLSGPTTTTQLLLVREDDHSIRNLNDVHLDLKVVPPVAPTFASEGRLCASSGVFLERLVPGTTPTQPPSFLQVIMAP
ncbi:MAG TPA: hypothetical protein VFG76_04100, partial [Candidatus Polarisedimenticolia bacterium]|nr:hypothetical protein [Candidatus Polarisedimenticolia bacterium]